MPLQMLQHSLIAMACHNSRDSSPRDRALYSVRFVECRMELYVVVRNGRLFVTWGPRLYVPMNILRLQPHNSREFPCPPARRELSHSDYTKVSLWKSLLQESLRYYYTSTFLSYSKGLYDSCSCEFLAATAFGVTMIEVLFLLGRLGRKIYPHRQGHREGGFAV